MGALQPSWHRGARGRDAACQAAQRRQRDREDDWQGQAGRLEGAGAKLVRDGRRALLQGTGRPAQARAPPPAPSRLLCRSSRSLPFTRTCLVVIQILGNGRSSYLEASPRLTPAFPTRSFRGLSPSSARDRYTNFLDTNKVRKNLDGTEAEQKMSQHCTSVCAYEWRLQKESP